MSNDNRSIAPSQATTFLGDEVRQIEERTTLSGKPINYQHDHKSNMMLGDGGAGFGVGNAGANILPPAYTDKSLVRIPIKMSDIRGSDIEQETEVKPEKKRGFFRKISSSMSDRKASDNDFKVVMMSRGDYLKYWAKDEDGKFLPTVEEPPEGREEWVKHQLELSEEWKKENPRLSA